VKFFSQNRFTSAFSLLFATAPTTTATAATRPFLLINLCGYNNQSQKQAFFKPRLLKCAQFCGRYHLLIGYRYIKRNNTGIPLRIYKAGENVLPLPCQKIILNI
jgi:hypothetical protein